MDGVPEGEVTHAIREVRSGDASAKDRLVRLVYDELRTMAAHLMRRERPDHTMQATDLADEAFVRLEMGNAFARSSSRRHLFGSASQAMREVLVDHARRRSAEKRGGSARRLPLDAVLDRFEEANLDLLSLHEALDHLASLHERPARVVTLRFFGGLRWEAIAEELGVSLSTVESDFRVARAWVRRRMTGDDPR